MKKLVVIFCVLVSFGANGQWNLNGTNVYYNGGLVGIGTTTPQGYLHVNPVRPVIIRNNGGNGVYGSEIGFNAILSTGEVPNKFKKLGGTSQQGGANIAVDYQGNMLFQMANAPNENELIINHSPQVTFSNTGNVGIGSTSPLNKLQIGSNPQGWNGNDFVISNNNPGQISLAISNANDHTMLYGSSDIAIRPGFGKWSVYAKGSDGYVGIGINNPTAPLQVGSGTEKGLINLGGYAHIGNLRSSGDLFAGMNVYAGYATSDENSKVKVLNSNTNGFSGVQMSYNGDINFFAKTGTVTANDQANTAANTVLKIAGNGNVGIGTTSPDAKLAVKGTIHTQEVKVDLTGAMVPDYVFEKNYNLQPLTEIESYINEHKHLPEVPSAKEMEENGLHLKEMNLLLLKKVEELTLHLLKQEKRIKALESKEKK